MRILFIIVGLVGLLLAGLVVFEIRAANDYGSKIQDVQSLLSAESKKEVADAHRRGAVFTGQTLGDVLSPQLDGFDTFRNGWFVVAVCSVTLLLVGTVGIFIERKMHAQTVTSLVSGIRQPYSVALIVVAIVFALASWPLLFVALVWKFIGEGAPPAVILFLSWIASGLFWGFFVELLYRVIRNRRPNNSLQATATAPSVLTRP